MTDPRRLANEHWRDTYRVLVALVGGEWRHFGAVEAFASPSVDYTFVNGGLALDPAAPADLARAIAWLTEAGTRYRVRIDVATATPELLAVPVELGLEGDESWRMPGMVLPAIPSAPAPPAGVTLRQVDVALVAELQQHLVDSGSPHRAFLDTLAPLSVASDELAIYVAYLDGHLAATSAVIRTGRTCGIYAVGTAEWARRRGVGSAVTWATLEHARTEWHCTAAVLQSSPIGVLVYQKMGFRIAAEYQLFDPPR